MCLFSLLEQKQEICLHLAKPLLLHRLKTSMVNAGGVREGECLEVLMLIEARIEFIVTEGEMKGQKGTRR